MVQPELVTAAMAGFGFLLFILVNICVAKSTAERFILLWGMYILGFMYTLEHIFIMVVSA